MLRNNIDLSYFLEWGGKGWENLFRFALDDFIWNDLNGKNVLEIGPRYGKISTLFALYGANVTGAEINPEFIPIANNEAKKWNVEHKVNFIDYKGDLNNLPDNEYDLVFTKSVLVLIKDLDYYLSVLKKKIKKDGQIVILENAYNNIFFDFLRRIKHFNKWDVRRATYFSKQEIEVIGKHFKLIHVKKNFYPPIYLICCENSL